MRKLFAIFAVVCSTAILSNADYKKVPSPFLGDTSKFKKADWNPNLYWFRHETKRSIDYKAFILDPVLIYQSPNSKFKQMTPEEIQSLSNLFSTMLQSTFGQEIKITDKPGPGVLRARFAIRGLRRGQYYLGSGGAEKIQPDTKLAAGTFEMEGIDSLTGELIVALLQNVGKEEFEKIEKEEVLVTIQTLFKDWVDVLKTVFLQKQYLSTIPK